MKSTFPFFILIIHLIYNFYHICPYLLRNEFPLYNCLLLYFEHLCYVKMQYDIVGVTSWKYSKCTELRCLNIDFRFTLLLYYCSMSQEERGKRKEVRGDSTTASTSFLSEFSELIKTSLWLCKIIVYLQLKNHNVCNADILLICFNLHVFCSVPISFIC